MIIHISQQKPTIQHALRKWTATLCTIAALVGASSLTYAQSGSQTQPPEAVKNIIPLQSAELENAPIRIDALKLNIYLPKGSVTESTSIGSTSTMGIGFPDQIGVMVIKEQKTTDPDLNVAQVADNLIDQLTRFASSRTGNILARDPNLKINTHIGERFYIRLPGARGKPDTVRGMTIFQSEPRKFIIFDFTTLYTNFDKARAYYETSVGTMDLGDRTESDVRRSAAIKSMISFLDLRSIDDFQSAMTNKKDRWERLYLPATTGDEMDATEYGYRKIKSWGGFKGELSDKPRSSWNNDDRSLGYFVQIDAMALEDEIRIDTRATFYMSEDTNEESWTIKMSLRRGTEQQTSTITGARSGTSMAIVLDQSDAPPSKTHPLIQGDGYMSQVQTYLIGAMLAEDAQPGEYASYAYNSSLGTISLRWDIVDRPEETPDLTRITTKVSNNTPPTVSLYNNEGDLLRVVLANKRIWEPIELDRLIKLWQKKGLPLE
jgi:hypothetical protein